MDLYSEALTRFNEEYAQALKRDALEPAAVSLATAGRDGRPSARTVLLRGADSRGFVFFTNYESRKGRQLFENPRAALSFFWDRLERQIQVEGPTVRVSNEESDNYWKTRPRDSQIGAWASMQSQPLASRDVFLARIEEFKRKFGDGEIPRPPHWGGTRLIPERIEFWQGMPFRLHERTVYAKASDGWTKTLVYP